jgi:transposase
LSLTGKKQEARLEFLAGGMTAPTAANLVGVDKATANHFDHRLREIIAWQRDQGFPFSGEVAVDESYFGGKRKGTRGRGAAGKVPVFGILKRGDKVYTKMIPDECENYAAAAGYDLDQIKSAPVGLLALAAGAATGLLDR